MAAGYETTRSFDGSRRDIEEALLTVLRGLGLRWRGGFSGKDALTVKVPINDCSWGERIEVEFVDPHTVRVGSKCVMPFQLYDWGKNKRNVLAIVSGMEAEMQDRKVPKRSGGESGAGACGETSADEDGNRRGHEGKQQRNGREGDGCGFPGGAPEMTLERALSILGLMGGVSREEIQIAYRAHAKKYHPDQVPRGLADDFRVLAEEKMKLINEAYVFLTRQCD